MDSSILDIVIEVGIVIAVMGVIAAASVKILLLFEKLKGKSEIVEFWMDGFNEDVNIAFGHIRTIYDKILHKDPLWHYFYEGYYSLIRCSKKYEKDIESYLREHNINHRQPTIWKEGLYVTKKYQHIYKHIFHYTSVLAIEMYKSGDETYYLSAADRIIHPFFNQSLYPAKVSKLCNDRVNFQYWEAELMGELAIGRAYHIGRVVGQKEGADIVVEKEKEKEEKNEKAEKNEEK